MAIMAVGLPLAMASHRRPGDPSPHLGWHWKGLRRRRLRQRLGCQGWWLQGLADWAVDPWRMMVANHGEL